MNLLCLQAGCWEELRISTTRFLFDTNLKYYLFKKRVFLREQQSGSSGAIWGKDNEGGHFCLRQLQVPQSQGSSPRARCRVCLFTRFFGWHLLCACTRARACPWVLPPGPFACFGCFVLFSFSPLTPRPPPRAGNTHWLPLSSLRSSFRSRGSGGWENDVQECRPSPGSLASVSAHY